MVEAIWATKNTGKLSNKYRADHADQSTSKWRSQAAAGFSSHNVLSGHPAKNWGWADHLRYRQYNSYQLHHRISNNSECPDVIRVSCSKSKQNYLVVYPRGIKTLDVSPQQCRMKVTTVDIPNFPQNKLITQNTSAHVWTLPKIQEECLGYTLWYAHKIVWKSGTIPINQSDYLHEPDQPPACTWWSGRHAATRAPRTAKAAKPTVSVQKTS